MQPTIQWDGTNISKISPKSWMSCFFLKKLKTQTNSLYIWTHPVSLWFSGLYSLHKTPQWKDLSPPFSPSSCPLAVTFTHSCLVFPQSRSAVTALPPLLPLPPPLHFLPLRRLACLTGCMGNHWDLLALLSVRECVWRRGLGGGTKMQKKKATTE